MTTSLSPIIRAVENRFHPPFDLKGPRRDSRTALARQVVMYLAWQKTGYTLSQIGEELGGRSPATVNYGFRRIADAIERDSRLKEAIFKIKQDLKCCEGET